MVSKSTDVLVVGGGPAGLAAAIAARHQGFSVIVADGAAPGIDKACGEGLMPPAVSSLAALGVTIHPANCHPITGVQFVDGEDCATARFRDGSGLGVRRTRLHATITKAAQDAGISMLWSTPVTEFGNHWVMAGGERIQFQYLIGADGQTSAVRRAAGLSAERHSSVRFGFRRHYAIAPWSDLVEVHWSHGCQVYITPVSQNEVGVAVLSADSHLRVSQALQQFPQLERRFRNAQPASSERGGLCATRHLRRVTIDHAALIGDASGSVDAITGDGLSQSFQQAEALALAMKSGDLSQYQHAHNRIRRRPALLAYLLLTLSRHDVLRRFSLKALAGYPPMFSQILALHTSPTQ